MAFDALIGKCNSAGLARFANATALVGAVPVRVIAEAPGKAVNLFEGGVSSFEPRCIMPTVDVATNGIDNGTALTITPDAGSATTFPAGNYLVAELLPDGEGMTTLHLTKG